MVGGVIEAALAAARYPEPECQLFHTGVPPNSDQGWIWISGYVDIDMQWKCMQYAAARYGAGVSCSSTLAHLAPTRDGYGYGYVDMDRWIRSGYRYGLIN